MRDQLKIKRNLFLSAPKQTIPQDPLAHNGSGLEENVDKSSAHLRVAKNSLLSFITRTVDLICGIVSVVLVARYLGVSLFGEYAFVRAVVFVLVALMDFGMARILVRDVSVQKNVAARLVNSTLLLNIILGSIACGIAVSVIYFFPASRHITPGIMIIAVVSDLFMVMTHTVSGVFVAYENFILELIARTISRSLIIITFFAIVLSDLGFASFFYALTVANLTALVFALVILKLKFFMTPLKPNMGSIIYILKESYSIAISIAMLQGQNNIFVFFLKLFRDPVEVSLFQAPNRLIQQILILPQSFFLAYVPILSRMASHESSFADLVQVYHNMLKYIMIFTLPFCIVTYVFVPDIVLLVFGHEFVPATASFRILVWAVILLFVNIFLDFMITALKHQNVLIISTGLCLCVSGILGMFLVNQFGYIGASWATLLAYLTMALVNFYYVSKYVGMIQLGQVIFKPLASAGMLMLILNCVQGFNRSLVIIPGVIFYFCVLYLLKVYSREEVTAIVDFITNLLKKKWGGRNK